MTVFILWEHYHNTKWIVDIYLSRESAEQYMRSREQHEFRIEERIVKG